MQGVLAEVASGAQCFSHSGPVACAAWSDAMAAGQSAVMPAGIAIDIDIGCLIDAEPPGASGIVHASADITSCCNSRQTVSSTIT